MKKLHGIVFIVVSLLFFYPTFLIAGAGILPYVSTCTSAPNCGANGQVTRGYHRNNEAFVIQVFAKAGECLRLDVTRATKDLDMLVAGPYLVDPSFAGNVWANDQDNEDGNLSSPRIVIDPAPHTGWYTVRINGYNQTQREGNFDLKAMRYNSTNPMNCNNPTPHWGAP